MILRTIPPAAAPLHLADLWQGIRGVAAPKQAVADVAAGLAVALGVRHVFPVSSGRAALTLILRALARQSDRQEVIVPGYTCYSVPAAVKQAGLHVTLCDVDPTTLDFDYQTLESLLITRQPLCVVATHLFGTSANLTRLARLCGKYAVRVVDDAAQAMAIDHGKGLPGTLGDIGLLSFGRGKAVTSVHGGAIVTDEDALAAAVAEEYKQLAEPGMASQLLTLAEALILFILLRPSVYWLPASLPFLDLGQTVYDASFRITKMSGAEAGLLRRWPIRLASATRARTGHALAIKAGVRASDLGINVGGIRLPILCGSREHRDRLLRESTRQGLGFSVMYPAALNRVPGLEIMNSDCVLPGADCLAERLLAVPVHPLLTMSDTAKITTLLNAVQPTGERA